MALSFRSRLRQSFIAVSVIVFLPHALLGQSTLESTIKQFDQESVRGYVQPFGDLFGATMNAGFYRSARIPENGFTMRIDLVGMATVVSDEHRMYDAKLPAGFVPKGGSYKTATVFGGRGTTFKDVESGLEYKGSDGVFDARVFPLVVPQVTIGSVLGTQIALRFISTPELGGGKFPASTLFGAGFRHSISQYFAHAPVDIAIGAYYSKFDVGDLIAFRGGTVNVQVSRSVSLITLYGGVAWEASRTDIRYSPNGQAGETFVNVTLSGGNTFRITGGLELDLQAVKLFADINIGYVRHFSGGIGFGF